MFAVDNTLGQPNQPQGLPVHRSNFRNDSASATRSSSLYTGTATPRATNTPSASTSMSFRYYQPPPPKRYASDSEEESSEEEPRRNSRRASKSSSQKRGACTYCKGLKVRCHFTPGQLTCQRCLANKTECTVTGRKKRRAVASHEELLLKSHKQDLQIADLLRQFDNLTTEVKIRSWLDKGQPKPPYGGPGHYSEPSFSPSSGSSSHIERDWTARTSSYAHFGGPGSPSTSSIANIKPYASALPQPVVAEKYSIQDLMLYFPDELASPYGTPPEVVARNVIRPDEVHDLFNLYFKFIHPFFSLLDPETHTPERVFWTSPFLFTSICCVSCRYSDAHKTRLPVIAEFARDLAGQALVSGKKSIEDCQAFLIQSVYPLPKKHFEDQRSWLTMGLAFSIAQEQRLNDPPRSDEIAAFESSHARESDAAHRQYMNRIRTWLNCYCVDASHATQFGKPAMLDVNDYVASRCRDWYKMPRSLAIDVHLVAYVELQQLMRHFRIRVQELEEREKGNSKNVRDVVDIVWEFHDQILTLGQEWNQRFEEHPQSNAYMCRYRAHNHLMINAFNRLVVLVYGLQRVISADGDEEGAGASRNDPLVRKCIDTAKDVIAWMTKRLEPTGMLPYAMEAHFLFVTFAAAHLLSLLRPKMKMLLRPGDEVEIALYVRDLVKVLKAQEVSKEAQGRHAPFRYARYLSRQLRMFAALLPRDHGALHHGSSGQASSQAQAPSHSPAEAVMPAVSIAQMQQTDSIHVSWDSSTVYDHVPSVRSTGYGQAAGEMYDAPGPSNYHSFSSERTTPLSPHCGADITGENANSLSGYPVDYSLLSFVHTMDDSQLSKETPPPDEPEDVQQWWANMFPVRHGNGPGGTNWPVTADVGRRAESFADQSSQPWSQGF